MKTTTLKANKIYSLVLLSTLSIILFLIIQGEVTFGYGLGDIGYILVLIAAVIFSLISTVVNWNREREFMITNVLLTVPSIWLVLKVKFF